MSQLTYSTNMAEGTPGLIANSSNPATILTGKNPVEAIPWGQVVAKITGTDGALGLPSASGDQIYGVAVRDTAEEGTEYAIKSAVAYLKRGQIYVPVEENVTPDDAVYVRYAGRKQVQTVVFSADIITSNVVDMKVDGNDVTVTYGTSNAATLTALALLIAAQPGVSTAVSDGTHTITVTGAVDGVPVAITEALVTLGASQATIAITETVVGILDSDRGKFRNDADTSTAVAVTSMKFITSALAGGVAIVDVNLP